MVVDCLLWDASASRRPAAATIAVQYDSQRLPAWQRTMWGAGESMLAHAHGYERSPTERDGIAASIRALRSARATGRWIDGSWTSPAERTAVELAALRHLQHESRGTAALEWVALAPSFSHNTLIGHDGQSIKHTDFARIAVGSAQVADVAVWPR